VRRSWALLATLAVTLLAAPAARASTTLQRVLGGQMRHAGGASGALAVDLGSGRTLYGLRSATGRMPASVEKLWTTSTALLRLGPDTTFDTVVRVAGRIDAFGVVHGNLYLVGGGDPTFGDDDIGRLAAQVALAGITRVKGRVVGDESYFDTLRGVPSSGYAWSPDVEPLSSLAYDRDVAHHSYVSAPAVRAAQALTDALRRRHIKVGRSPIRRSTPAGARRVAVVRSPPLKTFIRLTNQPSDNFYAETLIKDLGARLGRGGTTAAGAAVVRRQAARLGLHPRVYDGSGLSRSDRSSPRHVVSLLRDMMRHPGFTQSLAVTGRSGTLADRLRHAPASGRCRGKTGTLRDASNIAGFCRTLHGHTVLFAILMNAVYPPSAHVLQDRMVQAIVRSG
jgi:D-alanyl-D-alanine carboxypeptidase/D-alanyl-D-alanine-endopeptidase (penicillin-binding protein 4)